MPEYFRGWYYRLQSDTQTVAIIPSVHKAGNSRFCTVQLITDTHAFCAQFPCDDFQRNGEDVRIANNRFERSGIRLDIRSPGFHAAGRVSFGAFTPIRYDIMGPFRYVPFLQCRHSVFSMRHRVDGELTVNGTAYVFRSGTGYLEGDRGRSFPREYAWTQCGFPDGAVMLSVADVPLGNFHFTGIIGVVALSGKEYRLATYLGAKAVKIENGEIVIRQGRLCLTVRQLSRLGHPLYAPAGGDMTRTIREHPSCRAFYRLEDSGVTLLEYEAQNAAFEYEYRC